MSQSDCSISAWPYPCNGTRMWHEYKNSVCRGNEDYEHAGHETLCTFICHNLAHLLDRACAIKPKVYMYMRLSKSDDWIFVMFQKNGILRIISYVPRRPYVPRRRNIFFMDHGFNYRTFVCSSDYRKIRLLVSTDYRNIRLLVSNIKSNRDLRFFLDIFLTDILSIQRYSLQF